MAAFDSAALLARYRPVVQYDSLESYYTDWAAVITDRPGNVLKRADGTVLAAAGPPGGGVPILIEIVKYQVPVGPTGATPQSLVIGVDSSGGRLPPATALVPLSGATGELEAPVSPDAESLTVSATVHADNGAVSPTATVSGSPKAP